MNRYRHKSAHDDFLAGNRRSHGITLGPLDNTVVHSNGREEKKEDANVCTDCYGSGITHYNSEYCDCIDGRELQGESSDEADY